MDSYVARSSDRSCARSRSAEAGFTLVELLIVVTIIGILAALAGVGYKRYVGRARLTEAVTMLSEMTSKEQVYFLEFGAYLPLRRDGITMPSSDESNAAFYPADPNASTFSSTRTATAVGDSSLWPTAWRSVGLRVRENQLYCTYLTNAGAAGSLAPAGAPFAGSLVGTQTASSPAWYYSVAACNLNGVAGYPSNVTVLGLSSTRSSLATFNDGN